MLAWIRTDLSDRFGISSESRVKNFCDFNVYKNLMTQIWIDDADEFESERDRVSTALMIQLLFFSAGRIGALAPTGWYPDVFLAFSLLFLEEDCLLDCPTSIFAAIALADEALQDISSWQQLRLQKLDPGEDLREFAIKPEFIERLFLVRKGGRPISCQDFWKRLMDLSTRAGYLDYVRPFDIRRGTSNTLQIHCDTSSMLQTIGHAASTSGAPTYQKHYQPEFCKVDIKGLVLRGRQDGNYTVAPLMRNHRLKCWADA
ncbi:hypothetical protein EJ04DRAFT_563474 [Polyplosphaeria fusca]|uniref:Uncharacterized protein n=1 Tax=Polyplosphaeria fusca TaxID=682080 RepID=A0A9P4V3M0_9PLEO|nr:hypothetical protein EJ04DRAFT_563474 [Polyplosphaeria fusca]